MPTRSTMIAGHKRGKRTASYVLYSVWDNRTDEVVIIDGTAKQCAEMMGRSLNCFYSTVRRSKSGEIKRWTILTRLLNEEDNEEEDEEA